MDNYNTAKDIIKLVGGEDNITQVSHCMTRLRLRLKDEKLFEKEKIKNLTDVIDIVEKGGEYQIVVGPKVGKLYRAVVENTSFGNTSEEDQTHNQLNETKGMVERMMDVISSIFVPIIGLVASGGTLKGILALVTQLGWLSKESTTYILLYALAGAVFYFLPIILGATATKKFGGNLFYGAILGAAIMSPNVIALSKGEEITQLFGINFTLMDYSGTVLPILFGGWTLAKLQKLCENYLPSIMQTIFVPFISLSVSFVLTLFIIGPVMTSVNDALINGVMLIYGVSPVLAGGVLGGLWQLAIFTGIGWGFIPIFLGNIATLGYCPLIATTAAALFSQVGAALAASIRSKNLRIKSVGYAAVFSGFFGVTEPAIYGINFPAKKPFIIGLLSGAVGGIIAALMGAKQYAIGPSGLFIIPVFINPDSGIDKGFIGFVLSIVVSFILAFVLTYLFGYKNTILEETGEENKEIEKAETIIMNVAE